MPDKNPEAQCFEKRNFLTACMVTAEHDGAISENEYQILRGLAAAISCPLGPFIG